jgi:beta-lactamase class D
MKYLHSFLNKIVMIIVTCSVVHAQVTKNCFIAKENGRIVKQIGDITQRYSPYSTFKIPIALMGFDFGFLQSTSKPLIEFTDDIKEKMGNITKIPALLFWSRAHTPATWMQFSVVWYSQEITKNIGLERFNDYVRKFEYGNLDVSGNPGKSDGLSQSWLNSSLKISVLEQVNFIEKLVQRTLPVSRQAQEKTIELIRLEDVWDGWNLYGKTGGAVNGWFIGWIEKGERRIIFAQYIEATNLPVAAGRIAKELAKDNLVSVILLSEIHDEKEKIHEAPCA